MAIKYYNNGWRIPNKGNNSKTSNYSMEFDYQSEIIVNVSRLNSAKEFSISFWGKLNGLSSNLVLGDLTIPYSHGVSFGWQNGNIIYRTNNGSNNYLPATLTADEDWHHFVLTFNEGVRHIYVDGTSIANDTATATEMPSDLGNNFSIGRDNSGGTWTGTTGWIDQVAFFDYELQQDDITNLGGSTSLGAGSPMTLAKKPFAYYPLGDASAFNGSEYLVNNQAISTKRLNFRDSSWLAGEYANESTAIENYLTNKTITASIWLKLDEQVITGSDLQGLGSLFHIGARPFEPWHNAGYTGVRALFSHSGWPNYYNAIRLSTGHFNVYKVILPSRYSTNNNIGDFNDGKWHNIVVVYDKDNPEGCDIYWDGDNTDSYLFGTQYHSSSSITTGGYYYLPGTRTLIGKSGTEYGTGFKSQLSNFTIWEGDQSANIADIYNNGNPRTEHTEYAIAPLFHYKLGTETAVFDPSIYNTENETYGQMTITNDVDPTIGIMKSSRSRFYNAIQAQNPIVSPSQFQDSKLNSTEPFTKYALDFDASSNSFISMEQITSLETTGAFAISFWMNSTQTEDLREYLAKWRTNNSDNMKNWAVVKRNSYPNGKLTLWVWDENENPMITTNSPNTSSGYWGIKTDCFDGEWHHICFTYDGTLGANAFTAYLDGVIDNQTNVDPSLSATRTTDPLSNLHIAGNTYSKADTKMSNVSIWNANLTGEQVNEIYNFGVPTDLSNHSMVNNLTTWIKLGESSTFNGSEWEVYDEISKVKGTSTNMGEDFIVDGPATSGNGITANMGSNSNIETSAPNSNYNAIGYLSANAIKQF